MKLPWGSIRGSNGKGSKENTLMENTLMEKVLNGRGSKWKRL